MSEHSTDITHLSDEERLASLARAAVMAAGIGETVFIISLGTALWLTTTQTEDAWLAAVDDAAREAGFENGDNLYSALGVEVAPGVVIGMSATGEPVLLGGYETDGREEGTAA